LLDLRFCVIAAVYAAIASDLPLVKSLGALAATASTSSLDVDSAILDLGK